MAQHVIAPKSSSVSGTTISWMSWECPRCRSGIPGGLRSSMFCLHCFPYQAFMSTRHVSHRYCCSYVDAAQRCTEQTSSHWRSTCMWRSSTAMCKSKSLQNAHSGLLQFLMNMHVADYRGSVPIICIKKVHTAESPRQVQFGFHKETQVSTIKECGSPAKCNLQ